MGGFGTWSMGLTYPSFFCPVLRPLPAEVCRGDVQSLQKRRFCSARQCDDTVPFTYSKLMADAVNANGGNARLLKLDGLGHNDGIDFAYRNTEIIDWLLNMRRNNFDYVPEICEEMF